LTWQNPVLAVSENFVRLTAFLRSLPLEPLR
jgi:hypothetical protein